MGLLGEERQGRVLHKPIWMKTKNSAESEKNESFMVWIIMGGSYLINSSFGAEEKLRELFFEVSFVCDKMFKGGI